MQVRRSNPFEDECPVPSSDGSGKLFHYCESKIAPRTPEMRITNNPGQVNCPSTYGATSRKQPNT